MTTPPDGGQPGEEQGPLVVAFNPVPSAARVARHQATRFRLAVEALFVVVLGGLLWAIASDSFNLTTVMWMLGAWVVLFVVLFVIQNVRLHAARKDLLGVGEGPVLCVGPEGVAVRRELRVAGVDRRMLSDLPGMPGGSVMDVIEWSDLVSVRVAGSSLGNGPTLTVSASDGGRWDIPLSWMDTRLPVIDGAVVRWSRGRARVDSGDLDAAA